MEIGKLETDDDVICFNIETVQELAEKAGLSLDQFLERNGGKRCHLNGHGVYGIDQAFVVTSAGVTYPVAVIGIPEEGIERFLTTDEPSLKEWLGNRPLTQELAAEYRGQRKAH